MSPDADGPADDLDPGRVASLFRVVHGTPDDAEVAAVMAVLGAVTADVPAPASAEGATRASRWVDRAAHLRVPLAVGPHAWRTSVWPR